jgi:hypothetical protein
VHCTAFAAWQFDSPITFLNMAFPYPAAARLLLDLLQQSLFKARHALTRE